MIEIIFRRNNETETHLPDKNTADEFLRKFFYILYDNLSIKYHTKSELLKEFEALKRLFLNSSLLKILRLVTRNSCGMILQLH